VLTKGKYKIGEGKVAALRDAFAEAENLNEVEDDKQFGRGFPGLGKRPAPGIILRSN